MNKRYREKVIIPALSLVLVTVAMFVLLEVVFRFLPVSDYTYPQPVNDKNPVAKSLPNREMMFSKGWKFLYRNKVRVNNDGFINDLDYHVDDKEPLVAIVGDSSTVLDFPGHRSVSTLYGQSMQGKSTGMTFS
jgi:hypothetical protein